MDTSAAFHPSHSMSQISLDMSKPLQGETDDDEQEREALLSPCFRLPLFSTLVPFLREWAHQRKLTHEMEEETALKHMALEISTDDLGYSPPVQVSIGNGSSAILSCSTLAESASEDDDSPVEIHRCTSCSFRVSLSWRFCPECGMYIDGVVTTTTQQATQLDVTMLESNVDTPKREESFILEDLLDELE